MGNSRMINLAITNDRDKLASQIEADINKYCADTYNEGHRNHLGASIIGNACSRQIWYIFRWVKLEIHEGRIQRLFQVGHEAEPRFITYLKAIGFEVQPFDPTTGKQWRISAVNGHYGGSLDGMCKAPARYDISEDLVFLNEFKTNGTGSGFNSVENKGVMLAKPKHYAQMSVYGWHYKLKYGLYLIENKNDSDITVEIVLLNWNLGQELEKKAADIINAKVPPAKVSENPAFFECKFCHLSGICHYGEKVEKNCRSCRYALPVANGEWECQYYSRIIPKDFIKVGCNDHVSINGE